MSLEGKVVIVTGASSGIGAETCLHFVQSGAHVVAVGRNLENLKLTAKACSKGNPTVKCFLVQADVTIDAQKIVDETIAEFGKIDVLVNSVGILASGGILEVDVEQLDTILNTNLRSVFQLTKLVLPYLIASEGNVVNVSSVAGIRSMVNTVSYCISKAALDQFTKCVAHEMAPNKVRVNSVNPGVVVTDMHRRSGMDDKSYAEYLQHSRATHAMGRVGHVCEVAATIVFLASESANFITGALLPIDGGKSVMCPR